MKQNYIILDDDFESVLRTQSFFDNFPNYELAGTANSQKDAINLILQTKPELVFLEINSENKNCDLSLDIINQITKLTKIVPKFVALTLDKNEAYEAIKSEVFDFLVKPINIDELRKTLHRFEKSTQFSSNKLCIKTQGDYRFLSLNEVAYCKADNSSTDIFLQNGEMFTGFKSLKYFEQNLPSDFLRIHNSFVVNMNCITRINITTSNCYLGKTKIPFSKHYKRNIEIIINKLSNTEIQAVNEIFSKDILEKLV